MTPCRCDVCLDCQIRWWESHWASQTLDSPHMRGARFLSGKRGVLITIATQGGPPVIALCAGPGCHVGARIHGRWWRSDGPVQTSAEAMDEAIGLVLKADMARDAAERYVPRPPKPASDREEIKDIRRRLADPGRVVAALGLGKGSRPSTRGVMVRCPAHEDSTASCSVRAGKDGTIIAVCHGCQWRGDVLGLVAAVRGLDPRREFRRVLEEAARLAGVTLGVRERRVA